MRTVFLLILFSAKWAIPAFAEEGLWIPMLIKSMNEAEMREKGLRISAEEIYSVNGSSMKDAVFSFGGYCTASAISPEGLILTNHHCAGGILQSLSSPQQNLTKKGFWAYTHGQELAAEGLTVTRMVRMAEVTQEVLVGTNAEMHESDRNKIIEKNILEIIEKAVAATHYGARVEPFFYGNEYYLFVTETFEDVRLVGVPPQNIGRFGGDTDNWSWPRFSGDFAFFRVYTDRNGKPAPYSPHNIPLNPGYFFPITLDGNQKGDFTMVYGFPGQTHSYLTSFAVQELQNRDLTDKIELTGTMLAAVADALQTHPQAEEKMGWMIGNFKNHQKKWKEEKNELIRLSVVGTKENEQAEFQQWAEQTDERKIQYGYLLRKIDNIHQKRVYLNRFSTYLNEGVFRTGLLRLAFEFQALENFPDVKNTDPWKIGQERERLRRLARDFFRNFDLNADQHLLQACIFQFLKNIPGSMQPAIFKAEKLSTNQEIIEKYCEKLYKKSFLTSEWKVQKFLEEFSAKDLRKLEKDPAYKLMLSIVELNDARIRPRLERFDIELAGLNKQYMEGRRQQFPDRKFYPDANATLRLSYGKVADITSEGKWENWQTTLSGLMARHIPGDLEFDAGDRLMQLFKSRDWGQYSQNDDIPTCFIATNHTSSGSSGSPVINGMGQLTGVNFDRNREGTVSDILYNERYARNISVDIRYVLFITDKYAGAGYLLDEMNILQ